MAMMLAIAIAVMLDKWAEYIPGGEVVSRNRSTSWMANYTAKAIEMISNSHIKQNYIIIMLLLAPLIAILLLSQLLFCALFGTIGKILFKAAVLFYLLGNTSKEKGVGEFVSAHEHSFGILFWFALAGTIGALFYWFLIVSKKDDIINEFVNAHIREGIIWLHTLAAWIPARITGFIYALVGNFSRGFNFWLTCVRTPKMASNKVLTDCGRASTDASIESDEKNLVTRAYIAWTVLSIIIVLYK